MNEELKHVIIYTDGACEPNPGLGGYGVVLMYERNRTELSGGFRHTTNNRMEIYAVIKALESMKQPCRITVYSDSKYVIDTMTLGWAKRWKANDWWRSKKARAVNIDLWERLLKLCEQHEVEFVWVKGHEGNEENERCDRLSYDALEQADLPSDEEYEQRSEGSIRPISIPQEAEPYRKAKPITITQEGQPCRKCATPVIKRIPRKQPKRTQAYYFEYYLYCPTCQAMYMVEEAKRFFDTLPLN